MAYSSGILFWKLQGWEGGELRRFEVLRDEVELDEGLVLFSGLEILPYRK